MRTLPAFVAVTAALVTPLMAPVAHAQFISLGDSHKFIISNTEVARLTSSTRLGIGTQSPSVALEVSGTISGTAATITSMGVGNLAASGNITASGYVRAGFTSTCNSTLTGILRTSGTSVEFCDGTGWSNMGAQAATGPTNMLVDAWNTRTANTCYNSSGRYILRSTAYTKLSSTSKLVVEARLSIQQTSGASMTFGGSGVGGTYFDEMAYAVNGYEPLRLYSVILGISAGSITVNTYIGRNDTSSICYVINPTSSDNTAWPSATNSIVTIYEVP